MGCLGSSRVSLADHSNCVMIMRFVGLLVISLGRDARARSGTPGAALGVAAGPRPLEAGTTLDDAICSFWPVLEGLGHLQIESDDLVSSRGEFQERRTHARLVQQASV